MSDQITQTNDSEAYHLLEELVIDNPDLERLETLLGQFNIFEALGAVRVELRHSDFLAFLLNPYQNHGLGVIFLKSFLQRALASSNDRSLPFRLIDLDIWDFADMLVLREWQNIDITLVDDRNHFVTIIENKISSGEHSNQLRRYRKITEQNYPGWKKLYLFLTPDGEGSSDPEYISISYNLIIDIVDKISDTHASTIGPDVRTLLTHYSQMLRRYIVSESEIAELSRKIYRKHQRALDIIYEYRPDQQEAIHEIIENLITANSDLVTDSNSKSVVRFIPRNWDVLKLRQGSGWTKTGRMLLFEFQNYPNWVRLHLYIGPGPAEIREKLYSMAEQHREFNAYKSFRPKWNTIFQLNLVNKKDYEVDDLETIKTIIEKKWAQFLEHELPTFDKILKEQSWIWDE